MVENFNYKDQKIKYHLNGAKAEKKRHTCTCSTSGGNYVSVIHVIYYSREVTNCLPRSRSVSRHATLVGALRDETQNGCEGD